MLAWTSFNTYFPANGTIHPCNMAMGAAPEAPAALKCHDAYPIDMDFASDGRLLATASSDAVRLWDVPIAMSTPPALDEMRFPLILSDFSPDGKLLASASEHALLLWDAVTGAALGALEGHSGSVRHIEFSSDGKLLASASSDKTTRLWSLASRKMLHTFDGRSGSVEARLKVWDATTGTMLKSIDVYSSHKSSIAFSADGNQLAYASAAATIQVWSTRSWKMW
jgi:WD40 repeat protein